MSDRFDFLFSYWAFFWYLLYMLGLTTFSPRLALAGALLVNTVQLFSMKEPVKILIFIVLQIFIKVIPLYTLRAVPVNWTIDPLVTGTLVVVHLLWLNLNHTGPKRVYVDRKPTPMTNIILSTYKKE